MRVCARVRSLAPSVEPGGAFLFGRPQMIDPFTVIATALGFAMVASLMLATIER